MYTKEELAKRYVKLEDNQLLEILDESENYTEEAVSAAQEELKKRDLTNDKVAQYKREKAASEQLADERSVERLSLFEKIRFFFFGFVPFLNIAVRANYVQGGYALKTKKSVFYGRFGLLSLMIVALISVAARLPSLVTLVIWIAFFFVVQFVESRYF